MKCSNHDLPETKPACNEPANNKHRLELILAKRLALGMQAMISVLQDLSFQRQGDNRTQARASQAHDRCRNGSSIEARYVSDRLGLAGDRFGAHFTLSLTPPLSGCHR